MNPVFSAPINRPENQFKLLAEIRLGTANESNPAKIFLARITKLPEAMARLVAGPPMSERERYKQTVVEARAKNLEGLARAWFQPR